MGKSKAYMNQLKAGTLNKNKKKNSTKGGGKKKKR